MTELKIERTMDLDTTQALGQRDVLVKYSIGDMTVYTVRIKNQTARNKTDKQMQEHADGFFTDALFWGVPKGGTV